MRALVFNRQLRLITDYPAPTPQPGEALIRPHLVGICNTDIEVTRGYRNFQGVLGHEFVGTVVACADSAWIGQRVVGEITAPCYRCPTCLRGDTGHCPYRTTLGIKARDGVMADYFVLPIACLHRVPLQLPDEVAVFTEPTAAAVEILQQLHLYPTDRVAVIGDGKLGALIAQVVRLPGCAVTVVGHHPERWALFQRQGIVCTHEDALREGSFDTVIDCTGNPQGLAVARRSVRPRGRIVLKSTFQPPAGSPAAYLDLSMLVVEEIQVLGSRCGPFAPALRLLEHGLIETAPLLEGRFALDDALAAFDAAHGRLKIVIEI